MTPQISVLDAGGQYCHLIARRVRDLGIYADVQPAEIDPALLSGRRGVIISGGPASVYEVGSPQVDPALFGLGVPVLGICYGLQLMARALGGSVMPGEQGEYGHATIHVAAGGELLDGFDPVEPVWMSHRDRVVTPPPGFHLLASTSTCPVAAMAEPRRRLYGVQFHPEVVHTRRGRRLLENFLFPISGCVPDWDPQRQLPGMEQQIRETAAGRNVLFFASGGVDSTVAFALCLRALGPGRVHAAYVDTGLMREGETAFVRETFDQLAPGVFEVVDAQTEFLAQLEGVVEPELKRHRIGEEFVAVQERILERGHFLDGHWILGQGTIYPDTIESGGSQKADLIKTHHNRVEGIQRLIAANRVVEPLRELYKDEVRTLGRSLGLPAPLLDRHPFPGPGLAIRCLGSNTSGRPERTAHGWILPVRSVGVQGDSRTYRAVMVVEEPPSAALFEQATGWVNELPTVNRAVAWCGGHVSAQELAVLPATVSRPRLERLRRADAIVRHWAATTGFDDEVWQFPVILLPVGTADRPDSVVLRPVHSVDGMTASAVAMPDSLLETLRRELLAIHGVCALFYDLTHKPPGTIEWE